MAGLSEEENKSRPLTGTVTEVKGLGTELQHISLSLQCAMNTFIIFISVARGEGVPKRRLTHAYKSGGIMTKMVQG